MQEWQERHGVPSVLASIFCVLTFMVVAFGALAVVIIPAIDWFAGIQDRIPKAISNLEPLINLYSNIERFVDDTIKLVVAGQIEKAQEASVVVSG